MRAVVAVMVLLLSWPALAEDCRMPRVSRAMINELTANPAKVGFYLTDKRGTLLQGTRKPLTQHDTSRQTARTGSRADRAYRLERLGIDSANFYYTR